MHQDQFQCQEYALNATAIAHNVLKQQKTVPNAEQVTISVQVSSNVLNYVYNRLDNMNKTKVAFYHVHSQVMNKQFQL
mgnify:CR=1 FL=1